MMIELFLSLYLRENNYGKNILESAVIRSTTSSEGVDNYYKLKLMILYVRSNEWLTIGK